MTGDARGLTFMWLEITGRCQLECTHCYAESSPTGGHGSMTGEDWRRVLDQAAALGTRTVQFIGGEPTLHPALPELVDHAFGRGLEAEVFSNLVHIPDRLWAVLARPGVSLATSYYSDHPAQHETITTRRGSHARTRANIAEAVRRSIPLRVGVIDLGNGQRWEQAVDELGSLGVTDVGVDRLRQVGRGVRDRRPAVDQLCGNCADGVCAVAPDGQVWPCVFSRWLSIGNARESPLADIMAGERTRCTRDELAVAFAARAPESRDCKPTCNPCNPRKLCQPHKCNPDSPCGPRCGPACRPQCRPSGPCSPRGGCNPNYPFPNG